MHAFGQSLQVEAWRGRWRQVAERKRDAIATNARAVVEQDIGALGAKLHVARVRADDTKARSTSGNRLVEQLVEIGTISAAWDEAVVRPDRAPFEPAQEMPGVVGKRAHVGGADVQNMFGMDRRIGDAPRGFGASFDQRRVRAV